MIPYVILLILPVALYPIFKNVRVNGKSIERLPLLFFFAFMTFLVMMRHEDVGNDTRNYIYMFEQISGENWQNILTDPSEIAFRLMEKTISLFTRDYRVYLGIVAIIITALIYPTYTEMCEDTPLTIALYCIMSTFCMMFSGLRQMISIGIGFIAYRFTKEKKLIPFIIATIIAIGFHTSAFMLFFMYPVYHARITKKWLFIVIPVLLIIFAFNRQFFGLLAQVLQTYTRFEVVERSTGAYTMLILFTIFAVFSFLIPDEALLDKDIIGMRNLLLLSLIIQMYTPLNYIAMRMNYYYIIFIPLLLPKIINRSSVRYREVAKFSRYVMIFFFISYFFFSATPGGSLHTVPYYFFWENPSW